MKVQKAEVILFFLFVLGAVLVFALHAPNSSGAQEHPKFTICGDGLVDGGETCISCPLDVGACADGNVLAITVHSPPSANISDTNFNISWTANATQNVSCYGDETAAGFDKIASCFFQTANDGSEICDTSLWAPRLYYIWCEARNGTATTGNYSTGNLTIEHNNSWTTAGGNAQRNSLSSGIVNITGFTQIWNFTINRTFGGGPIVSGNRLYVGDQRGIFFALNSTNGTQIWNFTMDGSGQLIYDSTPALYKEIVYFGTYNSSRFYAINATSGAHIWNATLPIAHRQVSPVVDDRAVYFSANASSATTKYVFALNRTTGAQIWNFSTLGTLSLRSSPALYNGVIYVGLRTNVFALNASDGTQIWNFNRSIISWSDSTPLVKDGVVYILNANDAYAINASTGAQVWNNTGVDGISGQTGLFALSGERLVYDSINDAYSLNATNGQHIWNKTNSNVLWNGLAASSDVVFFAGATYLELNNLTTGAHIANYTLDTSGNIGFTLNGEPINNSAVGPNQVSSSSMSTAIAEGRVYLATINSSIAKPGYVYAFGTRTSGAGGLPNNIPTLNYVNATPTIATRNNALNCSFNITDTDADTLNVNITWFNGTSRITAYDNRIFSVADNAFINNASGQVPANATRKDEIWYCQITVEDGTTNIAFNSSNITILNSSPYPPTNLTPLSATIGANVTSTLNCSGASDLDGDSVNYNIQAVLQGTVTTIASADSDGIFQWNVENLTSEVGVRLRCNASDGTLTSAFINQSNNFTIDNMQPNLTIISPSNGTFTSSVNLSINFTANDTNLNNCLLINTTGVGTVMNCTNTTLFNLPNGLHNITIRANDSLNNVNGTTIFFTIDTKPPVINSTVAESVTSSSFTLTFTTNESANATVHYGTSISLGTNATFTSFTTAHSREVTGLSASTEYFYNITVCDQAGNCNTSNFDNLTTSAASTTPPAGGGGGGGSSSCVTESSKTWRNLPADKEISWKIDNACIAITNVAFTTNSFAQQGKVIVKKVNDTVFPGTLYQTYEIPSEGFEFRNKEVKFKVPESWRKSNNLEISDLKIYDSNFNELSTIIELTGSTHTTYKSAINEFGKFYIGSMKSEVKESTQKQVKDETNNSASGSLINNEEEKTEPEGTTIKEETKEKKKPFSWLWLLLLLLIILIITFYLNFNETGRGKKEQILNRIKKIFTKSEPVANLKKEANKATLTESQEKELDDYIKKALNNKLSKKNISKELENVGWTRTLIKEAFKRVG